jgi:hypothetical protein
MLRDDETLHVRLRPDFSLSFILARRRQAGGAVAKWEQIVSEQKLRTAPREAQAEQIPTLIRFLQKMLDNSTGEPDRVTCPRCGWLAGEKAGDGFACFNCRATWRD